jgi:hypothetical protein
MCDVFEFASRSRILRGAFFEGYTRALLARELAMESDFAWQRSVVSFYERPRKNIFVGVSLPSPA